MSTLYTSLFDSIAPSVVDRTQIISCTKPTLVHISHVLEDIVLQNRIPALMFTGFQESSHWAKETARYRELAQVSKQVCIFVGKSLPADSAMQSLQVELDNHDPLLQEWFVLILSESFSVLLCGKEHSVAEDDILRAFDTILSFDPVVIDRVVMRLSDVLQIYRPELVASLLESHRIYQSYTPNLKYFTNVINDMIEFEGKLNRALNQTNADLKQLNIEIQQERDLSLRLINDSPSLMAMTALDGTIMMINMALQKLIGISLEDAVGKHLGRVFIHPDDYVILRRENILMHEMGKTTKAEFRIVTTDGREVTIEWNSHLINDGEGKPEYILGIGSDITARKRAEQLQYEQDILRIELQKERELSDVRSSFMATVSHEFRTPLSTIQTSAELIGTHVARYTPDQIRQKIDRIKNQVAHLNMMISDVQRVVEMDLNAISLQLTDTNMVLLIKNWIEDISLAHQGSHVIHFEHDRWVHAIIRMDENLLRRIVVNLITNAIKFSPKGSIVQVVLQGVDNRMVISVADKGIGIPEEDQKRLFTPFYRASNVGAIGGTGLGLRIVKDTVEAYGGNLSYETSPSGTTFTVALPFIDSTATPLDMP